jgi:hypothetical protein
VKQVVKVRMLPTPEQAAALRATLKTCNEAASWLSKRMHAERVYRKHDVQARFYTELKARFGLSAQPAIRVIGKVAESHAALRANIEAGNYGPPGAEKRKKVVATPISFRADAAQPFDARCLSWQIPERLGSREATASIWATQGRCKGLRVLAAPQDLVLLRTRPIGETDLICRDGKWFLYAHRRRARGPAGPAGQRVPRGGSGHRQRRHQQRRSACRRSAIEPLSQATGAVAGAVAGQENAVGAAVAKEASPEGGAVRR